MPGDFDDLLEFAHRGQAAQAAVDRLLGQADPLQLGLEALEQTARRSGNAAKIMALVPLARTLAVAAGARGVTVGELREAAIKRSLLPAVGSRRELSYLGAVMRAAQLLPIEEWRRSPLPESHGNLHRVWILPSGAHHG